MCIWLKGHLNEGKGGQKRIKVVTMGFKDFFTPQGFLKYLLFIDIFRSGDLGGPSRMLRGPELE